VILLLTGVGGVGVVLGAVVGGGGTGGGQDEKEEDEYVESDTYVP